MAKSPNLHFEVDPSVVYQLGESLISDSVQALIELVKNCYDADATYAKVVIDTHGIADVGGAFFPGQGGRIIVEDDGVGMGLEDIKDGWLRISGRKKLEMKRTKQTTRRGRTPLGDKGLGRLGAQRLGQNLEIFTKAKGENTLHFGFSWLDFLTAPRLENVEIKLVEGDHQRSKGTAVVVSDLREAEIWRGEVAVKHLEQELSSMISPYREIRDFTVAIEVDGKGIDLVEMGDRVRDIAPVRYRLDFDGEELTILGRLKLGYFRPESSKEAELFEVIAEADDGHAFFNFLDSRKMAQTLGLTQSKSKQWFVEVRWQRSLAELDKVQRLPGNGSIANPGPFFGEVDSFDLGAAALQSTSVFDSLSEYRAFVKNLSGIRVYRDGFAIRVDHDWLKLGGQWTSAKSYYGLKPDNTLGYIALSARDNMDLEETTDREGFKDTPYYRSFYRLMEEFKRFSLMTHDFLGRSWAEFRKMRNEKIAQLDSRRSVEDLSHAIKAGLSKATQQKKTLEEFEAKLGASESLSKTVTSNLLSSKEITPELRKKVIDTHSDFERLLAQAKDLVAGLSAYLAEIGLLRDMGQVVEDRIDSLKCQMDDMYETVALGLTAEALSHEIFNVADELAKRAKAAQSNLEKKGIADRSLLAFIEHVQSSVLTLRKQTSYLSPALKYVRERREDLDVPKFVSDLVEFNHDRLEKNSISIKASSSGDKSFVVRMNKGKLMQVINNLVQNSEYWLREDVAQGRLKSGKIFIETARPFLRLYDDGRGIDPSVESSLFEPFVTMKARGQGRGLGLFIVKQLLDSEGCSISIIPERNRYRRLYKFQIDLRGALNE